MTGSRPATAIQSTMSYSLGKSRFLLETISHKILQEKNVQHITLVTNSKLAEKILLKLTIS